MKILLFSTLYPNALQEHHGVFVEQRLRHLLGEGGVEARVVAPVPWFPFPHPRFGRYGLLARVPRHETRHAIPVEHPRYPHLPKLGMTPAPLLLALGALPALRRLRRDGFDFQLIDAHYFYPDGVAALLLGRWLHRPVVITGRGSDLNLIPRHPLPRQMIRWAARHAAGVVTVCQALKEVLEELGTPPQQVRVLRNGVDLERFRPLERDSLRTALGLTGRTLLSVGHLIERKGHHLVIRCLPHLPADLTLVIIGSGPQRPELERLARELGVAERIRWPGTLPQSELVHWYNAADLLVLASSREGWANVLLEAMACGTPVVATPVWGTPEVVNTPAAGTLTRDRTVEALTAACRTLLEFPPCRHATRHHAEGFSWRATSQGQLLLFRDILERGAG